ncbi:cytochrome c oxidase assembly protein [Mucilaginibacter litoreus]|uniref:Cytochrome c oxidase assembly protein n=1 Tax=Mucilaginibacter litoreus TaxID=1048221 RepID=A0ABW3AWU3_9SPHI
MKPFTEQWHFDLLTLLLVSGIIYLYWLITGFRSFKNYICFLLVLVLFVIAEFSPLQSLGMRYFSVHMISHVVILLICGPLLMTALRVKDSSPLNGKLYKLSFFFCRHSWLAWLSGVGIMWFWHIPFIFDGSMNTMDGSYNLIPVLQAASMLLAGMLFSWPIFGPFKSAHLPPLSGIVYLFTACISCSLLGLLITFAPLNTWHFYAAMDMPLNNPWNISLQQDQQAAGLIMWVPCCFIYLSGCLYLLYRWFTASEQRIQVPFKLNTPLIHHD